jgi:hypothetical protein
MPTLNDNYWHAKTRRESWTVGLGPVQVNHFKSGLRNIPSYCYIYITNCELTLPDRAGTTTKMVPSHDGEHIPAIHADFVDVFIKLWQ